jgi:hypothetical protein
MQVSQQDAHITHAVLGNQESVSMGVSNDAALMHIFSATLYTYPKLATVREIVCNAWDAHIAAGITDRPIEVSVKEGRVTVRDYGFGIAHAKIGEIYGTYGNSTKRDDSTVTGGFGLGSKAPFAYTDNFEVISHHVGQKTIYRVSKSSMEKGGKPTINKIVDMPTQETGMQVSFSLIKESDADDFQALVREVIQFGEIPVKLNGAPVTLELPMSQSKSGYLINDLRSTIKGRVKLRYGNVVYPIPEHDVYADLYRKVLLDMECLWHNCHIIFMAEPDSITIAPSRETLILTDSTVEAITELLKKYKPYDKKMASTSVLQIAREGVNQQIKQAPIGTLQQKVAKHETFNSRRHITLGGLKTFETAQRAATANYMEKGCDITSEVQRVKMLRELKSRKALDNKLASKLIRAYSSNLPRYEMGKTLKGLFKQFVTAPIALAIKQKYPELQGVNTRCYLNRGHHMGTMYRNMLEAYNSTSNILQGFYDKKAVIGRSIKEVADYLEQEFRYKDALVHVVLVGSGKEADLRAVAAELMLQELGYDVQTHFPEKVKATRKPTLAADGTPLPDLPEKPRKKRDAYYTLAHSYCDIDRTFLLSRAREKFTTDTMVTDPVAYVVLNNRSEGARGFRNWIGDTCREINKLFGERIAVVTTVQAGKMAEKGVPRVDDFFNKFIEEKLLASADFKRYVAGAYQFADQSYHSGRRVAYAMCFHPELMQSLNLRLHVNKEEATFIHLAREVSSDFCQFPEVAKLIEKIKPNQKMSEVVRRMESSGYFHYFSASALANALSSYTPDNPKIQPVYELIRLTLK